MLGLLDILNYAFNGKVKKPCTIKKSRFKSRQQIRKYLSAKVNMRQDQMEVFKLTKIIHIVCAFNSAFGPVLKCFEVSNNTLSNLTEKDLDPAINEILSYKEQMRLD